MNMQAKSVLGMVLIECPRCGGTGEASLVEWPVKAPVLQRLVKAVDRYVSVSCPTCAGSGTTMARHVGITESYPRKPSERRRYVFGAVPVSTSEVE
jgi:ribosomal protein S27AE